MRNKLKLIVGNWKMNGNLDANARLLRDIRHGLDASSNLVAVCVPAPYLWQCQMALADSPMTWGAQDVSPHESGTFTGEVSGAMLADFGCRYVIVGHSERRAYHAESDELVAQKARRALQAGLTAIVCLGETLAQRDAGQAAAVVQQQLGTVLAALTVEQAAQIIVSYEPVWAIGTGKTATPEMAQQMHVLLRAKIAGKNSQAAQTVRILYGGSMKPENAAQLLAMPDIDGGLIGGAALKAPDFLAIVNAAKTHSSA
ncbi:MAG: triose-phosphate isomerase [Pseudomonadota bacterium]